MQLSKRLSSVANSVTNNNKVADIGCDHAYTSIYLIKNKIAPYVIAMDVNRGPLERAKDNIIKYGVKDRIDVRLSNGLDKLKQGETDTILIAGMGGNLMIQILSEGKDIVHSVKELVLQPQSDLYRLRRYLEEIGFIIVEENMLKDDGKYYVIMRAMPEDIVKQKDLFLMLYEEHMHFGRLLLEGRNEILLEFLQREEKQYCNIRKGLSKESSEKSLLRLNEIDEKLELIKRGLEYFSYE